MKAYMKWLESVLTNSEVDKKVLRNFITLLIRLDIPNGLALHTLNADAIKLEKCPYYFSVPERYLTEVITLFKDHSITEICEPDRNELYTVVGSI